MKTSVNKENCNFGIIAIGIARSFCQKKFFLEPKIIFETSKKFLIWLIDIKKG